ncbi:hypothetical protein TRFO_18739 [Tritrichomonas foetus]|uniref:Uncharacterized protein n=1 Tax=Tritrichomonas foetus TaxID=1144522 RepID=A0A1J4KKJ7_9EUKA|nr:hypothetical protein TRFO_18739 [Tritrichomonas foetus]|eukprot:OHT11755.1 hypothetical protein TRFO_18739 [Tritrichomonas foetus]
MNTICCAAKFFKFDSFKTFINKVLIPSLGKETVSSLSSYHSLDPAVQRCFFEEDVSDEDKTKLILDAANHHLIDKEKVENILPIPKAVSPETKLCYPSPMDIVVDIPPTNVPPQSFHQPNNQIPNYENADCPNPNDTNQLTGPPQFQPPAPQFEKVDTPPASTRFSSQIPKDEPNQQNLTQDLPQYPDQATNEPVVPPTSISSNEVAQKDVQENTSLENENEKDENMNKANHVSAIPDDLLDYINNLDKKETGNPVPVQNPAPSSLSSSSSISDQNDNQYQYNENLFPVAPIPPFEKDNWYLLKDALQAATDYVE